MGLLWDHFMGLRRVVPQIITPDDTSGDSVVNLKMPSRAGPGHMIDPHSHSPFGYSGSGYL
jgi:hypothetical protein